MSLKYRFFVLLHQKERLCYTILGNVQIDVGEKDEKYAE